MDSSQKKDKGNKKTDDKSKSDVERGTTNEIEILKLILEGDKNLKRKVLERIRDHKKTTNTNVIESSDKSKKE